MERLRTDPYPQRYISSHPKNTDFLIRIRNSDYAAKPLEFCISFPSLQICPSNLLGTRDR